MKKDVILWSTWATLLGLPSHDCWSHCAWRPLVDTNAQLCVHDLNASADRTQDIPNDA